MNTEFGKIASLPQQIDDKKSPLELEVEKMTKTIAMIALSIGAVVLVLGILINGFALQIVNLIRQLYILTNLLRH